MALQRDEGKILRALKENRLLFSGALGISVAFTGLLPFSSERDVFLTISLFCFAVSIPVTAMSVYLTTLGIEHKAVLDSKAFPLVASAGLFATFVGLVFLFWHFYFLAGFVFLGASVFAFIFAMRKRRSYTRA